jgi:hypothetical protein
MKIITKFKAKVFSFADIVVNGNQLTLRQITEPLTNSSSATPANPFPFGTDINGNRLNDPIPDTVFDPVIRTVISPPAVGTPALLDAFSLTKPELEDANMEFSAPDKVSVGDRFDYTLTVSGLNRALNGAQAVLTLPEGVQFVSSSGGVSASVNGSAVVVTLGRISPGDKVKVMVTVQALEKGELHARAQVRSATAMPVDAGSANTHIGN